MPPMKQHIQTEIAIALRCSSGNNALISASVDGMRVAPATPSTALAAISISGLDANAATTEATANAAAPVRSSRRRPMRSPSAPIGTRNPAMRNPYTSMIHSCWTGPACRSVVRSGSAR